MTNHSFNDAKKDIAKYNREMWDGLVDAGNRWTQPVSDEVIADARNGNWQIILTPEKPVPVSWFGELKGKDVLCLAGGGGQQGPILSATGANVTVFDNSNNQLKQDQLVAERNDLAIKTVQGDMRDLSRFEDKSFDLIVHPCSNGYVEDVNPVWRESFRVLRPGGHLMSGFCNPLFFLFDYWEMEKGILDVCYSIPYSDLDDLSTEKLKQLEKEGEPLSFGHSLDDQIGGQLRAGFHLVDMYEDKWNDGACKLLSQYISSMMATLCWKPA